MTIILQSKISKLVLDSNILLVIVTIEVFRYRPPPQSLSGIFFVANPPNVELP